MGRRHFGTARKLDSGRWQARYRVEGRRYAAPGTFRTKADALGYLSDIEASIRRGAWVDPTAGKVTLADYATHWLDARSDLRPTTRGKYGHLLRAHVLPALGGLPLASLAPSQVRAWYHDLAARHQTTADDAYRMLRAILNTAVSDGALGRSPCQVKGAGQVRSAERPVASVAELVAAVQAAPEYRRLALLLPAWLQCRRGEILGLQRRDVDLLHATVTIRRAWLAPIGGPLHLGPPKTDAGARTLSIPPHVLPALSEHLERYVGAEPDAWVFPGQPGQPITPRTLDRVWERARLAVGRPDLHLHDLRHSGLTWAAATGASVAELMRRGGHANPAAALRYQHATEDRDRALADALGRLAETAPVVPIGGTSGGTPADAWGTNGARRPPAP